MYGKTGYGLTALSILATISSCKTEKQKETKPNIILIMADDMGYSDISCYGSEINTPNIDRLAKEGIRFRQFYNCSRSCPTRASLLTGLYPHQTGMGYMVTREGPVADPNPYQGYLNDKCVTVANVLKTAGYKTAMSGKWHVGEHEAVWPTNKGFEKYFGLISGASNYFDISKTKREGLSRIMALNGKRYYPPKDSNFYMTTYITDYAIDFMEQMHDTDSSFFLYVGYTAPHWPLHALPEDIEKFMGKYDIGWDSLRKVRYNNQKEIGLIDDSYQLTEPEDEVIPWDELDEEKKNEMAYKMAVYAAQIYRMDVGIGKILDKLKKLGEENNTLVIFMSDNGACAQKNPFGKNWWDNDVKPGHVNSYQSYGKCWANASNTPLRYYKAWTHEGGIRTPFIARWPNVIKQQGGFSDQIGHVIDIMPTFTDISRADYPTKWNNSDIVPMQGKSLLPAFRSTDSVFLRTLFWEHLYHEAVIEDHWKLVRIHNDSAWKLYDMNVDQTETNDLSTEMPEKVNYLDSIYLQWANEVGVYPKPD